MAIKVCIQQVAFRCSKTTTVQPPKSSQRLTWTCPACAEFLKNNPAFDAKTFEKDDEIMIKRRLVRLTMRIHEGR